MSRTQVLTDEMWARIEPLLPPLKGPMGMTMRPHRPLVEGSIFRLRAGLAWRDLPAEFGPWQTVWKRHAKFSKDGTWDKACWRCRRRLMRPGRSTGTCRSTRPWRGFISTVRLLRGRS